uniref:Uncharacterized protein n=1 Tax=Arundo donax TaxID=35708 RepID=A0A0A9H6I9_ARUDO
MRLDHKRSRCLQAHLLAISKKQETVLDYSQ